MKIRYTPQAQLDLRAIKDYIGNKLMNKTAAIRISREILKSCSLLKDNPCLGRDLSDMIDEPSDYRYIHVVTNYKYLASSFRVKVGLFFRFFGSIIL